MSILNGPRINFFGGIEVDVSVPNNLAEYPNPKNEDKNENLFDPKTAMMTPFVYENNITDEDIINMFKQPLSSGFPNGGWNIYGQHSVVTNQVKVRSSGAPGGVSEHSPMVDMPFSLLGSVNPDSAQAGVSSAVMVDLNPLGSQYSQIVLGGILIGSMDKPLLHLQGNKICSNVGSGMISSLGLDQKIQEAEVDSPGSSMFSGTFQVTFTKDEIIAAGKTDNPNANQAIATFLQIEGNSGIVINFSFFEMCPKHTPTELNESYDTNQDERNPSVGRIIGTVGIAFDGESAQSPDGRMLIANVSKDINASFKCKQFSKLAPCRYATAYADTYSTLKANYLSVNMSIALTQEEFRSQRGGYTSSSLSPAINVGDLNVMANGEKVKTMTPDYDNYYKYGGIIDLELDNSQLSNLHSNAISIVNSQPSSNVKALNLIEKEYRIYSSDKNIYMGEKEGESYEVKLEIRYLGRPVVNDLTIEVNKFIGDGFSDDDYLDLAETNINIDVGQASAIYNLKNKLGSNADAGWEQVRFSYEDAELLINTRKYQFSDFGIAKGSKIHWDQVYENALRYHYLNFLGMSTMFPLNQAETIHQHREGIKLRTSSQYWSTSLYMPIVRSMSPSQVRLINAYSYGKPWDPDEEI